MRRVIVLSIVIFAVLYLTVAIILARAKPIVTILAKAQASDFVLRTVNDVISIEAESGTLRYERLVTLEKDVSGNVTALITNMALVNSLQSRISGEVAKKVIDVIDSDMYVPLGNIFGGMLFSGRGPKIPVRIESVTNASTRFTNEFASAGINQTRHRIMLEISVDVDILVPGAQTRTTVTTEVAVAETIIVGGVPNFYSNTNDGG
jgi:sporulation protein YunB